MSAGDGEWQVAARKRGKGRTTHRNTRRAAFLEESAEGPIRSTGSSLSIPDVRADHERACKAWRESHAAEKLQTIISDNVAHHAAIETAVCLGLGSFDPGPERSNWQRCAHVQLEAFLMAVKVLEKHSGRKIKCYAQEPLFLPVDKEYLQTLDVEPVETPQAYRYISGNTFLYGIHLPHKVWLSLLQGSLPGLCIGTSLAGLEETLVVADEQKRELIQKIIGMVRVMDAASDMYAFPEIAGDHTFSSTDIYWAKAKDGGGDVEMKRLEMLLHRTEL